MEDKILELPAGVRLMIAQKAHLDFMTRLYPLEQKRCKFRTKDQVDWKLMHMNTVRYNKLRAFKEDPEQHAKLAEVLKGHYSRTFFAEWSRANGYPYFNIWDPWSDNVYAYRYADWLCSQGMTFELWDLLVSNGLWFQN